MENSIFDTIIIGGGPAGCAAAVYAARKEMKALLVTNSFSNQSTVSSDIQNWIGEPHISGLDLAKKLEAHVKSYPSIVKVKSSEKVVSVKSSSSRENSEASRICDFIITTDKGSYKSKTVIVASGARRRKLGVPGEDRFDGKGVAFCCSLDGHIFKDKKVAVVGSGNAGLEVVLGLFPIASELYLLDEGSEVRGDPATLDEVKKNSKLKEIILNAKVKEILGETSVTGLKYDIEGQEKLLEIGAVFIEIGSVPNSEIVKDLVQLDEHGQVMVNFQHARTSHPGVFAAGDVTNDPYKQHNISAGDGARAALSAYAYLQNLEDKAVLELGHRH